MKQMAKPEPTLDNITAGVIAILAILLLMAAFAHGQKAKPTMTFPQAAARSEFIREHIDAYVLDEVLAGQEAKEIHAVQRDLAALDAVDENDDKDGWMTCAQRLVADWADLVSLDLYLEQQTAA